MMQLQQRNTGGNVGMSNDMKVSELFDYVRDRNQWLDQRFSEMDKRFERVDRNCGALVIWMDQSKKKDTAEREKGTKSTKNAAESGTDWRRIRKLEDQVDALQGQNERILELLERQQYRDPPAFRGGSTGFGTGGSPMRRDLRKLVKGEAGGEKEKSVFAKEEAPVTFGASSLEEIRERDNAYFDKKARELYNKDAKKEVAEFLTRQAELKAGILDGRSDGESRRAEQTVSDVLREEERKLRGDDDAEWLPVPGPDASSTSAICTTTRPKMPPGYQRDPELVQKFFHRLTLSQDEKRHNFHLTNSLDPDFKAKEHLNWRVNRTAYANLPVYDRYKRGGIDAYTVLKNIEGNHRALMKQLIHVCEAPVRMSGPGGE
eukprot:g7221.t1